MRASPPGPARRLLERVLRRDPAAPAILGDLHEDFDRIAASRGPGAARRWYVREALLLALGRVVRRGRPPRSIAGGSGPGRGRPGVLQDAGFAFRVLRRSPGFTLFTAAVIGLGVGAGTAVFSVLKPLMLAPLPFEDPASLVWISNEAPPGDHSLSAVTSRAGNLMDFRERAESFEGITGYNAFFEQSAYTLTGSGEPARLVGVGVAHDFLDVLGVRPLHGRGFTAEEGAHGGPPAVVLSHRFWRSHFAENPAIVGDAIVLNGVPRTVVGVLPPTFDFASIFTPGKRVDFLLPFPVSERTDGMGNTFSLIGRLRPGTTANAAQAELDAVIANIEREQPNRWGLGAVVMPLQARIAGPFRPALLLLAAAAGTLLLIVCVNVSNLILARSPGREREVAVRKALGATRGRLSRQLLFETLGIALAGAAIGSLLAWGATRIVSSTAGVAVPLLDDVRVDAWALLFATGVAVLTGLLVGAIPALRVHDAGEAAVLRAGGRGGSADRRARRLREGLVVAEVTLACVLLVAAGLLVRSFQAVLDVDLGFEPADAVAWQLNPSRDFDSRREESDYYAALTDRVAAIPGVEAVGLIDALPLGRVRSWGFSVEGVPEEEDTDDEMFPHMIDPGYLPAMGISLVAGRNIDRRDDDDAPGAMLINESGARRIFGDDDPLGRRIPLFGPYVFEIVGLVEDVLNVSPELGPGIQMYMPIAQMNDFRTLDMVVRSERPTDQVVAAVSAALREHDPAMPTGEYWTLESTVERAVSARRFTLGILSAFGAAALLLAALGIYGVLAQFVAERRVEIGIRMALGASARQVARSVLGRTLALTGAGLALGAVLALGGSRLLGSLLYGVTETDPPTFLATMLTLLVIASLAGALPALRAARTPGDRVLRVD